MERPVGGWKIARYDPMGRLEREVRLPVVNVTSCAFGGFSLTKLYVTPAWELFTPEQRAAQPEAGDLFRLWVDTPGLPAYELLVCRPRNTLT